MSDTPAEIAALVDLSNSVVGSPIEQISFFPTHIKKWRISFKSGWFHDAATLAEVRDTIRNNQANRTEELAREILATEARLAKLKAERDGHNPASSGN